MIHDDLPMALERLALYVKSGSINVLTFDENFIGKDLSSVCLVCCGAVVALLRRCCLATHIFKKSEKNFVI